MKRCAAAVAALFLAGLAGCTSANDMLRKDPVFFGHTTRTPQVYATCVADAWQRQGGTIKTEQLENGVDVLHSDMMGLSAALRVQQWANGSVEIRMSARSSYGAQPLVEAANLCM